MNSLVLTVDDAAERSRTTAEIVREALSSGDLRSLDEQHVDQWRRGLMLTRLARRWPR